MLELQATSVYEFKLRGNPWLTSGEQAVHARILITKLLQCLLANGLTVVCALDASRNASDKSSVLLLFSDRLLSRRLRNAHMRACKCSALLRRSNRRQ